MTAGRADEGRRPALAITHGENTVSAMKLAESARPLCDLIWVVDSGTLAEPKMVRLLRKLGTTIDTAGMSEDDAADALRSCRPDGILAYADHLIPVASALATRLGLDYHDATVTRRTRRQIGTAPSAAGRRPARSALRARADRSDSRRRRGCGRRSDGSPSCSSPDEGPRAGTRSGPRRRRRAPGVAGRAPSLQAGRTSP